MDEPPGRSTLIGIVGPCGSGKSTLIAGLESHGYRCRHIAQEHSFVPYMWERITHPDILIYLAATFPVCTARRRLNWTPADFDEQLRRLSHAREHADLIIQTDGLAISEVLAAALHFLEAHTQL